MNQALRRLQIMMSSPIQKKLDPRPRCEDCGRVLVLEDFQSYWDGASSGPTPRCCERCAEDLE